MNATDCTTLDQIAALIGAHDGKTESLLRLIGTSFEVRLGRAGREEQRRPTGRSARDVATLASERTRVAKEIRKLPKPRKVRR